MRTLRNIYPPIPLIERIPIQPLLTLADISSWGICLFIPADLYSHLDTWRPTPSNSPQWADSNLPGRDAVRQLVNRLSILLYFSCSGKYFQIVSYWVRQPCGYFDTYSIQFLLPSTFEHTLSWPCPRTDAEAIPSFLLLFARFVPLVR